MNKMIARLSQNPIDLPQIRMRMYDISYAEWKALETLYYTTDGANWTDKTGWLTDSDVNNWFGVTVVDGHVTQINLNGNGLDGDIGSWAVDDLPSLTDLRLNSTSVSGDIGSWAFPASLVYLSLHATSVSGDISGWTLPASLAQLALQITSISGDISGWTLPASLTYLNLRSTSVSGDISGWTLPASLTYLNLRSTSVSGDISGWTLPASLAVLYLHATSVSGDISGWTLPASLTILYLYFTSVSIGAATDIASAVAMQNFHIYDCGLAEAEVDQVLLDIYTGRAGFTFATPVLQIHGTNAAPSGVYQDGDPPTTGKEYAYELENDPETEGFNVWAITFTA